MNIQVDPITIHRQDYHFDEEHPEGCVKQMNMVVDKKTGARKVDRDEELDPSEKPLDLDAQALREYMLKRYARREQRRAERKKWQTYNSQRMLNAKEQKEQME